MSDAVRVTNMPDSGSRENVAFKLWDHLRYSLGDTPGPGGAVKAHLDLYHECLQATAYQRKLVPN